MKYLIYLLVVLSFIFISQGETKKISLTDQQVRHRAKECFDKGMKARMVYDKKNNVCVVKCYRGKVKDKK
jgi:hypothetical protein